MLDVVNKIVEKNKSLFSNNPSIKKIDVGFTNTIYNVDDKYIIKICSNYDNEEKFKKEINFYNSNIDNDLIPKLYYSDMDKKDIPYIYEIIEKIDGVTLYDVWHTFTEKERKDIIRQLCEAMKRFHKSIESNIDWVKKTSAIFINEYDKAKSMNLFSVDEIEKLDKAYSKFPQYLVSNEFVLIHNDLHFDNIFYKDGKIKLIDFERSMYAPRDFELDILYRMIRKPWKFASEENEQYTKLSDYENIMTYIEEYYPELIHINNLYERLAIYDIVYYLKQYINYPHIDELKEDIMNAVNYLIK